MLRFLITRICKYGKGDCYRWVLSNRNSVVAVKPKEKYPVLQTTCIRIILKFKRACILAINYNLYLLMILQQYAKKRYCFGHVSQYNIYQASCVNLVKIVEPVSIISLAVVNSFPSPDKKT